jgi:lipopolysaccharide transport system ATP-binding protein
MNGVALRVSHLSKRYRLGAVGTGTFTQDLGRLWHRLRGRPEPHARTAQANDLAAKTSEDAIWALQDVSFDVEAGEAVGIIGRNGAGKTTLLKILSRVTTPTLGEVRIRGRVSSLLEVGIGFHPELTGRENVYLNGAIFGLRKAEIASKLDEIVEFAGISRYLDTPVKRYSSGMYVRLGFAVAAHLDPEILVVDEVLAVGDAEFQRKSLERMQAFVEQGGTVIFVSHNMSLIQRLCPRAILLDRGRIVAEGPTNEIVDRYLWLGEGRAVGFVDLSSHPGRRAQEQRIFTGVGLRARGSEGYRAVVTTGDTLIVEIHYDCGSGSIDWLALGVEAANDQRILTLWTDRIPSDDGLLTGRGVVECEIPAAPFAHGEYWISLEARNRHGWDAVDGVYRALRFNVQPRADTTVVLGARDGGGYFVHPSSWRLVQQSLPAR